MARILFLVWKLEGGGAERQLVNLAKGLAGVGHAVTIGVWEPGGGYERDLQGSGVGVQLIPTSRVVRNRLARMMGLRLFRLVANAGALAERLQPDVVHGYMDTGNFIAAMMRRRRGCRVVWGLRASALELSRYDLYSRLLARINRRLSPRADLVICNSAAGARDAAAAGYPADRLKVVYNGIDIERFRHTPEGARRMRERWGLRPGERLIGMAARLDPMKGYENFAAAARLLAARRPEVRFVCAGEGADPYRAEALGLIRGAGLGERLAWQGHVEDVPAFYSALDVATSASSFGEGFSNAVAEAMACGVPCVVTAVGDSAFVVGDAGIVVPPRDPEALARAWEFALDGPAARPRVECRARIAEHFSIPRLVAETEAAILPPELPRLAGSRAASQAAT